MTYGDIGTPMSQLAERYSQLAPCLQQTNERWWHCATENCQEKGIFQVKETEQDFQVRCNACVVILCMHVS